MQPRLRAAHLEAHLLRSLASLTTVPVRRPDRPMDVPSGDLPEIPRSWQVVDGSHGGHAEERFIGYQTGDRLIVTVQSTRGAGDNAPGPLIALVTLGRHRISIVAAGPGRFEARWQVVDRSHTLAAGATTLGRFLPLVLDLNWP